MPSPAAKLLRDDLLAQLQAADQPLTTSHLRRHAPRVPVPGAIVLLPPLREQCYRILCALRRDGLATQASNEHHIIWSAAPGAADAKIAALEAAYNNYDLVETP